MTGLRPFPLCALALDPRFFWLRCLWREASTGCPLFEPAPPSGRLLLALEAGLTALGVPLRDAGPAVA